MGRFIQPDTIVPEPGNTQTLNRYSYTYNNPARYTDPTGHIGDPDRDYGGSSYNYYHLSSQPRFIPAVIRYIHGEMITNANSIIPVVIWVYNYYAVVFADYPFLQADFKARALGLWASQVMDARIKSKVGPFAPLVGNWDHKRILTDRNTTPDQDIVDKETEGYSDIGGRWLRFDIWSNLHYGYMARLAGFTTLEATGGAGVEQIGSDVVSKRDPQHTTGTDNWLSGWDDPSDNAAIRIGMQLAATHGTNLYPVDIYLAVKDDPNLASKQ